MALRRPVPLNQFYKLEKDPTTGLYVKTTTRWNNVVNGHNFDSENCMAAMGAVALDAHTGGQKRTYPGGIRNRQDDFSGGIGVDDVAKAWMRGWGEQLITPTGFNYYDVRYQVAHERRFVIVGGDYDQISWDEQCQKGGTFDHAIGLQDYLAESDQFLAYDSLCTNPHYIPGDQIRAFGNKLANRVRGTTESWFIGLTRQRTEVTPVTYRYGGQPRQRGRYALVGAHRVYANPRDANSAVKLYPSGTTIAVRQTTWDGRSMSHDTRWRGTDEGRQWLPAAYLRYLGPTNGTETIR